MNDSNGFPPPSPYTPDSRALLPPVGAPSGGPNGTSRRGVVIAASVAVIAIVGLVAAFVVSGDDADGEAVAASTTVETVVDDGEDADTGPGLKIELGPASPPSVVDDAPPLEISGTTPPETAAPDTAASLPEVIRFQVGQCLTTPADTFEEPVVVACDDPLAVDRVTAVAEGTEIDCPSANGPSVSHTTTRTNDAGSVSFSWCTEPIVSSSPTPPLGDMNDGLLAIGSCYSSDPTADGKVTITEEFCMPGLGRFEVVGESPDADCSEVPSSTGSLGKIAAEGTGNWCVREFV